MTTGTPGEGPLRGLRVLDVATLVAGPMAAMLLADFGADVIKVEHPRGDPLRRLGPTRDGVPLTWKVLNRNKRAVTLDLSRPRGQELLRELVKHSDVLLEGFRPGTLEGWGLAPDALLQLNPRLVVARVSGFGQHGPYRHRPGFGTLAEAMSGLAALSGEPEGPPLLPPFALADGAAALATACGIQMALLSRERTGQGQVLDVALLEPLLTLLGAQPTWFDQLGLKQPRRGNRSANSAPRNVYRTRDDRWVALSTSTQSVAERVMRLIGHPELLAEPWFQSGPGRLEHADLLDALVGGWVGERTAAEVMVAFEEAEAALAPIYDVEDVLADPQYQALGSITTVEDAELGPVRMQNVMYRLSGTPGAVHWAGRPLGQDNASVYGELLGLDAARLDALRAEGVL